MREPEAKAAVRDRSVAIGSPTNQCRRPDVNAPKRVFNDHIEYGHYVNRTAIGPLATANRRFCLVWWPRIWTRNTVEPMRTSGTGRADALARAGRYAVALGAIGGGDEIVFVVLFGLGRLVDHRRLGGVELQTLVACSLSGSLELPTVLPALSAATNLRVTSRPDRSLSWRPCADPPPQWVSATSDGGVPRTPNTVRRHHVDGIGIGRYVSRFDATGGGPCSGGK